MNITPEEMAGAGPLLTGDLTDLYGVPVPALRWVAPPPQLRAARRRAWRRAGMLAAGVAAVAAALASIVVVPMLGDGAARVDAQTILTRAAANADSAAGAAVQPYHAIAVTTIGDKQDTVTETWVADASHFRSEQRGAGAQAGSSIFGETRDGDDMWLYMGKPGSERAVHGPASALTGITADGIVPHQSLAELLQPYMAARCSHVAQTGTSTVAGRAAYVITVTPDPDHCMDSASAAKLRTEGRAASTMWVDEQTFLPLRVEVLDRTGALAYRYDVTEIEVGTAAPATSFRYEPATGAGVIEVTDAAGVKRVLLGITGPGDVAPQ